MVEPDEPTSRCVSALEPDFRLSFEEVALDDEPQEITELKFVPGSPETLLMLDKQGRVRRYELLSGRARLSGKFQLPDVEGGDDCGAVALAFDPLFATNHYLYASHCVTDKASRITRVSLADEFDDAAASAVTIIELGDERAQRPWHNVGSIGFDDENVMWALFGDKTLPQNAQDRSVPLGKLLRILPSRALEVGGFEPAEGNSGLASDPSVYALGLRSPWKGARDERGRYWVGDVGADSFEELNLIDAADENLGWPLAEGTCTASCSELTDPLLAYDRAADHRYALEDPDTNPTFARSIWVAGPLSSALERDPYACNLRGLMLFGDYFTGWVRAASASPDGTLEVDQPLGHLQYASAFAQAEDGTLYATTLGIYKNHGTDVRGRLYRALPATLAP
jgi:glucose/arabinose dehydrogenase